MARIGLLIAILCGYLTQELILCSPRDAARLTINSDDYYTRFKPLDRQPVRLLPPKTETEYGLKTIQTGSVYVPANHKGPVHIGPNHNLTKTYLSRVDTTIHHLPHRIYRRLRTNSTNHGSLRRLGHHRAGECVRCPSEKILIAKRGLDGVLVESPRLLSCRNRIVSDAAYQLETLFGDEFNFLLPHGTHAFHGKIRNKRSGRYENTCLLRYKVVVQQCGRYYPNNRHLKVRCDIGAIWGSKCFFQCRKGLLSHSRPVLCGDSLEWEGDEPKCIIEPTEQPESCDFLAIPDNGRFSCQYPKDINVDNFHSDLRSPEGSICRIKCDRNYEIPPHLESHNIFQCSNGRWNTTINDLCRPKIIN